MSIEANLPRRLGAGFLALLISLPGYALDRSQHGQYARCREGDCDNGRGTIERLDIIRAYTGTWQSGRFTEGTYQVQYPGVPGTFPMRYGVDGLPKEGTMVFANGGQHDVFIGTLAPPPESFVTDGNQLQYMFRKQGSVLRKGRYVDGRGYILEGEFEYIPQVHKVKSPQYGEVMVARGLYVFLGARIDEALKEVENGVFVSHEVGPDMPVIFSPASASYLDKLQEGLIAARSDIQREKAAAARSSRETWNTLLGVLSGVAVLAIASRATAGGGSSSSMGVLKNVLNGNEAPGSASQRLQASAGAMPQTRPGAVMSLAEYQDRRSGAGRSTPAVGTPLAVTAQSLGQPVSQAAQREQLAQERATPTSSSKEESTRRDIIEPNPYVRDMYTSNGWFQGMATTGGWALSDSRGATRAEACETALGNMNRRIDERLAIGNISVTDKTNCVCRTQNREILSAASGKDWLCAAYYRVKMTKDNGVIGR